jgi:stringent starvation protein B
MTLISNEAKPEILAKLLEEGMVLVTFDARHSKVRVPEHLAGDPQLRLNISYRFDLPMELDESGIYATLTFGGTSFDCFIPWSSLYMCVSHVSGQPFLFPDEVPEDFTSPEDQESHPQKPHVKTTAGPNLRVIQGASQSTPRPDPPTTTSPPTPKPRGSHLKVVK